MGQGSRGYRPIGRTTDDLRRAVPAEPHGIAKPAIRPGRGNPFRPGRHRVPPGMDTSQTPHGRPDPPGPEGDDTGLYAPDERYTRDLPPDAPAPPPADTRGDRRPAEPPAGADTGGPPAGA